MSKRPAEILASIASPLGLAAGGDGDLTVTSPIDGGRLAALRSATPAEFDGLAVLTRSLGFKKVVAGPFVRSSYHADEMVDKDARADRPA